MHRWLPSDISTFGAEVDRIFYFIYYLTGITFLLVAGFMIYFLVKYRDRGDGRRAIYTHGNDTLEVIWTVIPALVFIFIGIWSERSWAQIKKELPPPGLVVQLTAKQFNWAFTYPGPDGQHGTKDDPKPVDNRLRVPANQVVHLVMQADDVIHSFFVPELRVKQDAVPGRTITMWFEATQPGKYEIACAELCGFGHTTMRGELWVLDEAEWSAWAASDRKVPAGAPTAQP